MSGPTSGPTRGKVCLRCDWSGDTRASVCPECGTVLYGTQPAKPKSPPPPAPERTPTRPAPDPARLVVEPSDPSPRPSRRRAWVAGIAIAAVAAIAIALVNASPPPGPEAASGPLPGLQGDLTYAAHDPAGWVLWTWDLATGIATEGPHVEHPAELISASDTSPGWIGVTSVEGRRRTASLLHSLTPDSPVIRIASGDLVTWSAGGQDVTSLRFGPRTNGCMRRVVITSHVVAFGTQQVRFDGPMCGLPLTLARDGTFVYVVAAHGTSASIRLIGSGYTERFVDDHVLVGLSKNGDFLLTPVPRPGEVQDKPPPGLQLYYRSPIADGPVSFGTSRQPLLTEAFLSWSWDASEAYVLGSYGGVRGVYRVTMGPGVLLRRPDLVERTDAASVQATVTSDGGLFLILDGELTYEHDGRLEPLALPQGAPQPAGPLLWSASAVAARGVA